MRHPFMKSLSLVAFVVVLSGCGGGGGGGNNSSPPPAPNALTVTTTDPLPTANGAALNGPVSARFSEPVDPATLSTTSFTLADANGVAIPGSVSLSADGLRASFTPTQPLAYDTDYQARLTPALRSTAGGTLTADHVWG